MNDQDDLMPGRPDARRFAALVVITAATAIALGHTLRQPSQMGANDISRWCTVWSLLERGSYIIDECPWQIETQDKVFRAANWSSQASAGAEPAKHFYSSKPQFLATVIAGILYPARRAAGVPLDRVVLQERAERWTQKPDPDSPVKVKGVLEKPDQPVKWPAFVFYFKPILVLGNVLPFAVFLVLFARVLDRYAPNDWTWFFGLAAAAFGTYLLPFTQTLNNHTIAAFSAFFALYQFLRIWDEWELSGWRFAGAGFFSAFAAATELPALAFLALLLALLLFRYFGKTVLCFLPAAAIPIAGLAGTQYAAFGEIKFAYEAFGTEDYLYEGSLWKTPLELDALYQHPESYGTYLFHITLGHHGIFALSPIFLFSAWGALKLLGSGGRFLTVWTGLTILAIAGLVGYYFYDPGAWTSGGALHQYLWVFWFIPGLLVLLALLSAIILLRRGGAPMTAVAWLTAVLTVVVLAFYTWKPEARNYGGSTQGLRWLFWLIPFWLLLLPKGVEAGQSRGRVRRLALVALAISALSVGYAMRNPWSHPWILDALEHLDIYNLTR
jgi:hypothetical protein